MKKLIETFVTVDPGLSGAIVIYTKDDIQIMDNRKTFSEIIEKFREIKVKYKNIIICIEKVGIWKSDLTDNPGKVFGTQKLTLNYNNYLNAFSALQLPFIKVSSKKWRGYLNLYVKGEDYKQRKMRNKKFAQDKFKSIKVTTQNQDALCLLYFIKKLHEYDRGYIEEFGVNINRLAPLDYVKED